MRATIAMDFVLGNPTAQIDVERYGDGAICFAIFKADEDYPTRAWLTDSEAEQFIAALRAAIEEGRDTNTHGA